MCGFCGYINYKRPQTEGVIKRMVEVINHRGPDDSGVFNDLCNDYQVSLGHARLSIIDLSPLGHQPMQFENLTIVYNGEVYNYKEIRDELYSLGHTFVSNSDTEVILHSFKEWGRDCVTRFIGMFAFVIYDKVDRKLYICRDRAGVKPLYYYLSDDCLVFGSELKSIMQYEDVKREIDNDALTSYFEFGYIPQDQCILKDAYKLEAGHWLTYDISAKKLTINKYWDIQDYYNKPKLNISYEDAKKELINICKSAFSYRLVSDVPVGLALSGGYDSTLVASILTKELGVNINTFTIGFGQGNNEAPDAEMISKHLGTNHNAYYCTYQDAIDIIPNLQFFYDEPYADSSAIPTILVSKLAKQKVTVLMSADGGDEIFCGYTHYDTCEETLKKLRKIPLPLLKMSAAAIHGATFLFDVSSRKRNLIERLDRIAKKRNLSYKAYSDSVRAYPKGFLESFYSGFGKEVSPHLTETLNLDDDSLEYLLLKDYKQYMKDDVLVKVDRATMSVSLEGREPLLDHRISEFAAQLPLSYKYEGGVKKRILKDIVHQYVPKQLMDKPKRGFAVPITTWLKSELKDFLLETLCEENMKEIGFDTKAVNRSTQLFLENDYYSQDFIWKLLQYRNWYNKWMK